jgi:hypothetical protein
LVPTCFHGPPGTRSKISYRSTSGTAPQVIDSAHRQRADRFAAEHAAVPFPHVAVGQHAGPVEVVGPSTWSVYGPADPRHPVTASVQVDPAVTGQETVEQSREESVSSEQATSRPVESLTARMLSYAVSGHVVAVAVPPAVAVHEMCASGVDGGPHEQLGPAAIGWPVVVPVKTAVAPARMASTNATAAKRRRIRRPS